MRWVTLRGFRKFSSGLSSSSKVCMTQQGSVAMRESKRYARTTRQAVFIATNVSHWSFFTFHTQNEAKLVQKRVSSNELSHINQSQKFFQRLPRQIGCLQDLAGVRSIAREQTICSHDDSNSFDCNKRAPLPIFVLHTQNHTHFE